MVIKLSSLVVLAFILEVRAGSPTLILDVTCGELSRIFGSNVARAGKTSCVGWVMTSCLSLIASRWMMGGGGEWFDETSFQGMAEEAASAGLRTPIPLHSQRITNESAEESNRIQAIDEIASWFMNNLGVIRPTQAIMYATTAVDKFGISTTAELAHQFGPPEYLDNEEWIEVPHKQTYRAAMEGYTSNTNKARSAPTRKDERSKWSIQNNMGSLLPPLQRLCAPPQPRMAGLFFSLLKGPKTRLTLGDGSLYTWPPITMKPWISLTTSYLTLSLRIPTMIQTNTLTFPAPGDPFTPR